MEYTSKIKEVSLELCSYAPNICKYELYSTSTSLVYFPGSIYIFLQFLKASGPQKDSMCFRWIHFASNSRLNQIFLRPQIFNTNARNQNSLGE